MSKALPEYASLVITRLPKGGPDRVRFCIWYADALDTGADHFEALKQAHKRMWMMYLYASQGILDKLGPTVGGIPPEYIGEE